MAHSKNRKALEIPMPLYEELKRRSEREGTTVTSELLALVRIGRHYEDMRLEPWLAQS